MSDAARSYIKKTELKKQIANCAQQKNAVMHSVSSPIDHILRLQQAIGNQAVQRLIKQSRVKGQGSGVGIQMKLTVGQPNDIHEQEADRIAEQVMRMPDHMVRTKPT